MTVGERGTNQRGWTSAGPCSIEGCQRGRHARGWCDSHYERWRRYGNPTAVLVPSDFTPEQWFWRQVDQSAGPDACWPWTRYRAATGYGRCREGWAHRQALIFALGRPLRSGMEAAHSCDNPACCNPRHLREADRAENMRDAVDRLRMPFGERNVHAKLTLDDVRAIRAVGWSDVPGQARRYGISVTQVRRILQRKRWAQVA